MTLILVIDDEELVRRMVLKILARLGHETLEAADGRAGLKLAAAHKPAVVITDIVMPNIEGLEVIREIRDSSPATRIIAMSGGGPHSETTLYLNWAANLGADAMLAKPFGAADLIAVLEPLLPGNASPP